jgi:hypothetical protein
MEYLRFAAAKKWGSAYSAIAFDEFPYRMNRMQTCRRNSPRLDTSTWSSRKLTDALQSGFYDYLVTVHQANILAKPRDRSIPGWQRKKTVVARIEIDQINSKGELQRLSSLTN